MKAGDRCIYDRRYRFGARPQRERIKADDEPGVVERVHEGLDPMIAVKLDKGGVVVLGTLNSVRPEDPK